MIRWACFWAPLCWVGTESNENEKVGLLLSSVMLSGDWKQWEWEGGSTSELRYVEWGLKAMRMRRWAYFWAPLCWVAIESNENEKAGLLLSSVMLSGDWKQQEWEWEGGPTSQLRYVEWRLKATIMRMRRRVYFWAPLCWVGIESNENETAVLLLSSVMLSGEWKQQEWEWEGGPTSELRYVEWGLKATRMVMRRRTYFWAPLCWVGIESNENETAVLLLSSVMLSGEWKQQEWEWEGGPTSELRYVEWGLKATRMVMRRRTYFWAPLCWVGIESNKNENEKAGLLLSSIMLSGDWKQQEWDGGPTSELRYVEWGLKATRMRMRRRSYFWAPLCWVGIESNKNENEKAVLLLSSVMLSGDWKQQEWEWEGGPTSKLRYVEWGLKATIMRMRRRAYFWAPLCWVGIESNKNEKAVLLLSSVMLSGDWKQQ